MTNVGDAVHFDITPRRSRPRRDWRRAVRAVRALVKDPDRTELAFEVLDALDPDVHERTLASMLRHPEGRRIYAARPSLYDALSDREALAALPEGSFGRAYLDHLDRHGLDAGKLVALARERKIWKRSSAELRWIGERSTLTHDLWHVLTGYGADEAGESALLLFSLAQAGGFANVLLSIGANSRITSERGPGWLREAWRAWRMGRRATCLHAIPYEELLPLPLGEVRRAAGIDAH